jgi:hypothetical protein
MSIEQRTVTIRKGPEFSEYMSDHHGHAAFRDAIGYLAEWNMWSGRFDAVTLTCSLGGDGSEPTISASYRSSVHPDAGYFICAIFQPQSGPSEYHPNGKLARFNFHS